MENLRGRINDWADRNRGMLLIIGLIVPIMLGVIKQIFPLIGRIDMPIPITSLVIILELLIIIMFYFSLNRKDKKIKSLEEKKKKNIQVIRNQYNRKFLVIGDICRYIPDSQTLDYLASYFGFSRGAIKLMKNDEIDQMFTKDPELPSILPHCHKTDVVEKQKKRNDNKLST